MTPAELIKSDYPEEVNAATISPPVCSTTSTASRASRTFRYGRTLEGVIAVIDDDRDIGIDDGGEDYGVTEPDSFVLVR